MDYRFYRAKSLMIELLASRGIESTTSLESICIEKLFERRRKITYSIKDIDRRPLRSKQAGSVSMKHEFLSPMRDTTCASSYFAARNFNIHEFML